jgi:hypothetical protein
MMELTKIQRNDIFNAVRGGGLDPATCGLKTAAHNVEINHASSESRFLIGRRQSDLAYRTKAKIGEETGWKTSSPPKWRNVLNLVQRWSQQVAEYEEIPDLWTLKVDLNLLQDASRSIDNSSFTSHERLEISSQLQEIKNYLRATRSLTEEQFGRIEENLNEADDASSRIGRKDWALLLMGTMLTLILSGLIPPDVAQHILTMTLQSIGHLFGGGRPGGGILS